MATLKQVYALAAAFCQELRKPASHLLALMDDPIGWGKMLWSCTADVLGKNLLHNIYFPAQGWEQKATRGKGRFFSWSGGSWLDLPFRAWTSRKQAWGPEAFLHVGSYAGARNCSEVVRLGWSQWLPAEAASLGA